MHGCRLSGNRLGGGHGGGGCSWFGLGPHDDDRMIKSRVVGGLVRWKLK